MALQVSVIPRSLHWASSSQEQPNPGMQIRPAPHGANVGGFALHSHRCVVLLQLSAFARQLVTFRHEHGGCPSSSVVFRHCLPSSHGANEGALKLHSQIEGTVVLLQVSALSKQWYISRHEHAG